MNAEVVGEEYLPLGSYDVKGVIEKIASSRADVILNTINGGTNVPFFKELRAAGITPDRVSTISFSIGEQELRLLDVDKMAGDYAAWNYFQSIDSPENRAFVTRFREKYGPQRVLNDPTEAAYIGVKLWAKAAQQARSDDPRAIRRALVEERMLAPEGEVLFDAATGHAFKTPRIGQITPDGQFDVVWKAVKPEAPVPFPSTRTVDQWREFLAELYAGWGNRWSASE
jgi:urea transport system substrate-binding protein